MNESAKVEKHQGRPRKHQSLTKLAVNRRKARLSQFGSALLMCSNTQIIADQILPQSRTISVTLKLSTLVLIDMYIEFVESMGIGSNEIHHGSVINSLVGTLHEDKRFLEWSKSNFSINSLSERANGLEAFI